MELRYQMNHKYRGQALIIGNDFAHNEEKERLGCEKDLDMMEALFSRLDFRVIRRKNLTAREMVAEMRIAARDPMNEKSDCFVMVISTHGRELGDDETMAKSGISAATVWKNAVFGQDGYPLYVDDIVKIFLDNVSPRLEGKPRLFFIQACRSRPENPVGNPKYDFGHILEGPKHWAYSNVDVKGDVDDLFGELRGRSEGTETVQREDNFQRFPEPPEGQKEHKSNLPRHQTEDGHGDEEEVPISETPFDIVPVNCPNDFLIMYPTVPGKVAVSDSCGSFLLQYMYKGDNLEKLIKGDGLLQYLTYVSGDMAATDYLPDFVMENKSEEYRMNKLKKYMENSMKQLSEDKDLLIRKLRTNHGEQLKTLDDAILVQEYLKNHLHEFTEEEMQELLKHLMPIKMCACIVHRLRDNIIFTAKTKNSPLAKLVKYLKYFRSKTSNPQLV